MRFYLMVSLLVLAAISTGNPASPEGRSPPEVNFRGQLRQKRQILDGRASRLLEKAHTVSSAILLFIDVYAYGNVNRQELEPEVRSVASDAIYLGNSIQDASKTLPSKLQSKFSSLGRTFKTLGENLLRMASVVNNPASFRRLRDQVASLASSINDQANKISNATDEPGTTTTAEEDDKSKKFDWLLDLYIDDLKSLEKDSEKSEILNADRTTRLVKNVSKLINDIAVSGDQTLASAFKQKIKELGDGFLKIKNKTTNTAFMNAVKDFGKKLKELGEKGDLSTGINSEIIRLEVSVKTQQKNVTDKTQQENVTDPSTSSQTEDD